MRKNVIIVFSTLAFFLLFSLKYAIAQPSISTVAGRLAHKDKITINGAGFGGKFPAAPLLWDNCEGKAVNSDSAVTASGWVDVWPAVGPESPYPEARTRYRSAGLFRGVAGPHDRSQQYLAGCHYQPPNNSPGYNCGNPTESSYRNVMVTADSGAANKDTWFVTYYHRLDPNWSRNLTNLNHKIAVVQTGAAAYTGSANVYTSFAGPNWPEQRSDADVRISNGNNTICGDFNPWDSGNGNPRLDWIRIEYVNRSNSQVGIREVFVNNKNVRNSKERPGNCPNWINNSRSFTIGGYYRHAIDTSNNNCSYRGDVNNYRYFDDMYVDTTWSRVMLANHSDYSRATTVEPQIPSSWSDGSITCQVNLGRLPADGTAYLFVFDSNNNRNAVGFPMQIEISSIPIAPEGLTIVR